MSKEAGPRDGDGPIIKKLKTPCWIWQRCVDQDGYGYFRRDRRHVRAHIHYYEQKNGPTPPGLELDHTCRNRRCCNPDHLEPVTHIENCRRGGLVTTGMTIEKAREVRALRAQGVSYNDIAAQMNIGKSLIGQIVGRQRFWPDQREVRSGHWRDGQFERLLESQARLGVSAGSRGRISDGLPNRLDRIASLGNAVVPQVAELIGNLIVQAHARAGGVACL